MDEAASTATVQTTGGAPSWGRASILGAAAGAFAGLGLGATLLFKNPTGLGHFQSWAVFLGLTMGALAAVGALAGIVAWIVLRWTVPTRDGAMQQKRLAAFLGAAAGAFVGYRVLSEIDASRILQNVGLGAGAALLTAAGWRLACTQRFFVSARALAVASAVGAAAFAFVLWDVKRPREVSASIVDFVPKFDPLPEEKRPKREPREGRIVVLGVDGATWDKIDPLIAAGELPAWGKLREEGAACRLRTMIPTASPAIWTTMATGHTPKQHGIEDFVLRFSSFGAGLDVRVRWKPLRRIYGALGLVQVVPVPSNLRQRKAIWNILTEMGMSSATLGLWATYPAEPVNGAMVSDAATPSWIQELSLSGEKVRADFLGVTHPPELAARLAPLQRAADSLTRQDLAKFVTVDDAVWREFEETKRLSGETPLHVFRGTFLRDEFLVASALELDRERPVDLLFCYVRLIDMMGHSFWNYRAPKEMEPAAAQARERSFHGAIDRAYLWSDGVLAKFLERLGPKDTLVVVSDHGWQLEDDGKGGQHWNHEQGPEGVLAVLGPGVRRGYFHQEPPHVLDIGPTLLQLCGLPKGEDMGGRFLSELFTDAKPQAVIPTWETSVRSRAGGLSTFDAAARLQELEGVGYLR